MINLCLTEILLQMSQIRNIVAQVSQTKIIMRNIVSVQVSDRNVRTERTQAESSGKLHERAKVQSHHAKSNLIDK